MNTEKRLLISDMDHTLIAENGTVSQENLETIARHVAGGGLFTVASGRGLTPIKNYAQVLSYVNAPIIASNGSLMVDVHTDEVLYHQPLPDDLPHLLEALLETFPSLGMMMYTELDGACTIRNNQVIEHLFAVENRSTQQMTLDTAPRPWNKILMGESNAFLKEVEAWLKPRAEGYVHVVFSDERFLEILPLGVSKGATMVHLMEHMNLTADQVVTMGDAMNDYEMVQRAGVGVAVGNAIPALKEVADAVTSTNDESAVAQVLRTYFPHYQTNQDKGVNPMKEIISTTQAPGAIGPYSQAVKAGGFVYVSGQLPLDPATGAFAGEDITSQTRQSLTNVKAIVEAAGLTLADVVRVGVFLKDMNDFVAMNQVYGQFFTEQCPARAAVEVARLPKDALVEIECVAYGSEG